MRMCILLSVDVELKLQIPNMKRLRTRPQSHLSFYLLDLCVWSCGYRVVIFPWPYRGKNCEIFREGYTTLKNYDSDDVSLSDPCEFFSRLEPVAFSQRSFS